MPIFPYNKQTYSFYTEDGGSTLLHWQPSTTLHCVATEEHNHRKSVDTLFHGTFNDAFLLRKFCNRTK